MLKIYKCAHSYPQKNVILCSKSCNGFISAEGIVHQNPNIMKHLIANLLFLCAFIAPSTAQKSDYWVCKDPKYADKSQAYLFVSQIELTPDYTIVSFDMNNANQGETFIMACNSFKLMYNHKKVAKLVKTSNIPIQDVIKRPFECADVERSRKVKAGQRVSFKLYFTPIPKEADFIDIIEYNGTKSCEFDVFQIDVRRKTPTQPQTPAVAQRTTKVPPLKKPIVTPKPKPEPAIVVVPKPEPKVETPKKMTVQTKKVNVELWDNDVEDGDIISLSLNGKLILAKQEVKKEKFALTLDLKKGANTFEMTAIDAGRRGPYCTAKFSINDGSDVPQAVILQAEAGKSQQLTITVE